MFAKIRKGNGFGGCLDYITRVKAAPTSSAAPQPQAPAITLSTPSLGSQSADGTNMVLGGGLSDDFAHFLKMHPGLSIEEAKRKFKEQQKLKAQQRKGLKMHHTNPKPPREPNHSAVFFALNIANYDMLRSI